MVNKDKDTPIVIDDSPPHRRRRTAFQRLAGVTSDSDDEPAQGCSSSTHATPLARPSSSQAIKQYISFDDEDNFFDQSQPVKRQVPKQGAATEPIHKRAKIGGAAGPLSTPTPAAIGSSESLTSRRRVPSANLHQISLNKFVGVESPFPSLRQSSIDKYVTSPSGAAANEPMSLLSDEDDDLRRAIAESLKDVGTSETKETHAKEDGKRKRETVGTDSDDSDDFLLPAKGFRSSQRGSGEGVVGRTSGFLGRLETLSKFRRWAGMKQERGTTSAGQTTSREMREIFSPGADDDSVMVIDSDEDDVQVSGPSAGSNLASSSTQPSMRTTTNSDKRGDRVKQEEGQTGPDQTTSGEMTEIFSPGVDDDSVMVIDSDEDIVQVPGPSADPNIASSSTQPSMRPTANNDKPGDQSQQSLPGSVRAQTERHGLPVDEDIVHLRSESATTPISTDSTQQANGRNTEVQQSVSGSVQTKPKPLSKTLSSACRQLLNKLINHRSAGPFREPVDPVEDEAPNYFDLIKNPMDLSTVEKKLTTRQYADVQEFVDDIELMLNNCFLYNPPANHVHQMGRDLEAFFERELKKCFPDRVKRNTVPRAPIPTTSPSSTAGPSIPERRKSATSQQRKRPKTSSTSPQPRAHPATLRKREREEQARMAAEQAELEKRARVPLTIEKLRAKIARSSMRLSQTASSAPGGSGSQINVGDAAGEVAGVSGTRNGVGDTLGPVRSRIGNTVDSKSQAGPSSVHRPPQPTSSTPLGHRAPVSIPTAIRPQALISAAAPIARQSQVPTPAAIHPRSQSATLAPSSPQAQSSTSAAIVPQSHTTPSATAPSQSESINTTPARRRRHTKKNKRVAGPADPNDMRAAMHNALGGKGLSYVWSKDSSSSSQSQKSNSNAQGTDSRDKARENFNLDESTASSTVTDAELARSHTGLSNTQVTNPANAMQVCGTTDISSQSGIPRNVQVGDVDLQRYMALPQSRGSSQKQMDSVETPPGDSMPTVEDLALSRRQTMISNTTTAVRIPQGGSLPVNQPPVALLMRSRDKGKELAVSPVLPITHHRTTPLHQVASTPISNNPDGHDSENNSGGSGIRAINTTVGSAQQESTREEAVPKKKRLRKKSPEELAILQEAFRQNPMPHPDIYKKLAEELGVERKVVQRWFGNERFKVRHGASAAGFRESDATAHIEEDDQNQASSAEPTAFTDAFKPPKKDKGKERAVSPVLFATHDPTVTLAPQQPPAPEAQTPSTPPPTTDIFMDLTSSPNERTMIASSLMRMACPGWNDGEEEEWWKEEVEEEVKREDAAVKEEVEREEIQEVTQGDFEEGEIREYDLTEDEGAVGEGSGVANVEGSASDILPQNFQTGVTESAQTIPTSPGRMTPPGSSEGLYRPLPGAIPIPVAFPVCVDMSFPTDISCLTNLTVISSSPPESVGSLASVVARMGVSPGFEVDDGYTSPGRRSRSKSPVFEADEGSGGYPSPSELKIGGESGICDDEVLDEITDHDKVGEEGAADGAAEEGEAEVPASDEVGGEIDVRDGEVVEEVAVDGAVEEAEAEVLSSDTVGGGTDIHNAEVVEEVVVDNIVEGAEMEALGSDEVGGKLGSNTHGILVKPTEEEIRNSEKGVNADIFGGLDVELECNIDGIAEPSGDEGSVSGRDVYVDIIDAMNVSMEIFSGEDVDVEPTIGTVAGQPGVVHPELEWDFESDGPEPMDVDGGDKEVLGTEHNAMESELDGYPNTNIPEDVEDVLSAETRASGDLSGYQTETENNISDQVAVETVLSLSRRPKRDTLEVEVVTPRRRAIHSGSSRSETPAPKRRRTNSLASTASVDPEPSEGASRNATPVPQRPITRTSTRKSTSGSPAPSARNETPAPERLVVGTSARESSIASSWSSARARYGTPAAERPVTRASARRSASVDTESLESGVSIPKHSTNVSGAAGLSSAVYAAFLYGNPAKLREWDVLRKAQEKSQKRPNVLGRDNLEMPREGSSKAQRDKILLHKRFVGAKKAYHRMHLGLIDCPSSLVVERKCGRELSLEKVREIVGNGGFVIQRKGRNVVPPGPKRNLTRVLESRECGVGCEKGVSDVISSRTFDRFVQVASHKMGSGHTSQLRFGRQEGNGMLLLASSHFANQSPEYNQPGGVVLWDVECYGWDDEALDMLRTVGTPNDEGTELQSHTWRLPRGNVLNSNVMDLAFSPDGAFLFTVADRDPAVKAWWAGNASLKLGMTMKGGGANFWGERMSHYKNLGMQRLAVKSSNAECKLAAASYDGSIRVFRLCSNDGKRFRNVDVSPAIVNDEKVGLDNFRVATDVTFGVEGSASNELFFGGYERLRGSRGCGEVKVFNEERSALIGRLGVGENAVACLAVSPSGECLAVGATGNAPLPSEREEDFQDTGDGLLRLFDLRSSIGGVSGESVTFTLATQTFETGQKDHNVVGFSPCERYIFSCSDPHTGGRTPHTVVFDRRYERRPVHWLEHGAAHSIDSSDGVTCALFTSSGLFLTGGQDQTVRIWDIKCGDPLIKVLDGHSGPVSAMALSDEEEWLAVGTTTGKVHLWSTMDKEYIERHWDEAVQGGRRYGMVAVDGR